MTAIAFDTLRFSQTLQEAGFEEKQAMAITQAFRDAQNELNVATKADIDLLRSEMREMEQRLFAKIAGTQVLAIIAITAILKFLVGL